MAAAGLVLATLVQAATAAAAVSLRSTAGTHAQINAEAGQRSLELRVLTYNLDCAWCDLKTKDPWHERLAYFSDILNTYDPDIAW